MEFSGLYCSLLYKNRKTKPWIDGHVVISKDGQRASLLNEKRETIDSILLTKSSTVAEDEEIIFERHLALLERKTITEDAPKLTTMTHQSAVLPSENSDLNTRKFKPLKTPKQVATSSTSLPQKRAPDCRIPLLSTSKSISAFNTATSLSIQTPVHLLSSIYPAPSISENIVFDSGVLNPSSKSKATTMNVSKKLKMHSSITANCNSGLSKNIANSNNDNRVIPNSSARNMSSAPNYTLSLRNALCTLYFVIVILQGSKATRELRSPNQFNKASLLSYRIHFQKLLVESILVQLGSYLERTLPLIFKYNLNEEVLRQKSVSFYSDCFFKSVKSHPKLNDHIIVSMSIENKEHHTLYSRDDIWVVTDDMSFQTGILAKSVYYGVSSDSLVELIIMSKEDISIIGKYQEKKLYALRGCNYASEFLSMDVLSLHAEKSLLLTKMIKSLKNMKAILTVVESDQSIKWTRIISTYSIKYRLNTVQNAIIEEMASMLLGRAHPIKLIHGVFGAGKSFMIAMMIMVIQEAIQQKLLDIDYKIVLTSFTNLAVDRVLLILLGLGYTNFVRVGSVKNISKGLNSFVVKNASCQVTTQNEDPVHVEKTRDDIKSVLLIGVTCQSSISELLDGVKPKIMILDESSQMTEPMSMIPILRFEPEIVFLFGDPLQLPPTITTNGIWSIQNEGIDKTLFSRLQNLKFEPLVLRKQYRCHPKISQIANNLFYNGILEDGISDSDRISPFSEAGGFSNISFIDSGGEESKVLSSYVNNQEADFIRRCALSMGKVVGIGNLGVITLYKGQSNHIKHLVMKPELDVSTVDAFQGAEKEIIFLSTVRSNNIGFINDKRRMNVAITRAKTHLIICGNKQLLESDPTWSTVLSYAQHHTRDSFISKLNYIVQQSHKNMLGSDFEMIVSDDFSLRDIEAVDCQSIAMQCISDQNINFEPPTQHGFVTEMESEDALNSEGQIHTSLIEIEKPFVDTPEVYHSVSFLHSYTVEEDFDFEI